MKILKILKNHIDLIFQIIPLTNQRFASCSKDCTVKIWEDKNYNMLSLLTHKTGVLSILQLKEKNILVSCGNEPQHGIHFWDIDKYLLIHTIEKYSVDGTNHIIELQNGNIALSCNNPSLSVVIINSCTYETLKTIKPSNKILSSGSLCLFDETSFIYFCGDTLIQISNDNYSILYTSYNETSCGDIIQIQDGKHFAIMCDNEISIIKDEVA